MKFAKRVITAVVRTGCFIIVLLTEFYSGNHINEEDTRELYTTQGEIREKPNPHRISGHRWSDNIKNN